MDVVRFDLGRHGNSMHTVTRAINDESLTDLVAEYEAAEGFDHAGGYGGLVPEYRQRFNLSAHRRGRDYGGFGPCVFKIGQYCDAVSDVFAALAST